MRVTSASRRDRREAQPGDRIWIHDYQLMLVPAMLRKRLPHARIGFFLHIPFPSSEVFRTLPWREELLDGLLGADLIGFHTFAYLGHFTTSLLRILGIEPELDRVSHGGRSVRVDAFPMGIDGDALAALADQPDVLADARPAPPPVMNADPARRRRRTTPGPCAQDLATSGCSSASRAARRIRSYSCACRPEHVVNYRVSRDWSARVQESRK